MGTGSPIAFVRPAGTCLQRSLARSLARTLTRWTEGRNAEQSDRRKGNARTDDGRTDESHQHLGRSREWRMELGCDYRSSVRPSATDRHASRRRTLMLFDSARAVRLSDRPNGGGKPRWRASGLGDRGGGRRVTSHRPTGLLHGAYFRRT